MKALALCLSLLLVMTACKQKPSQTSKEFLDKANKELKKEGHMASIASWIQMFRGFTNNL